MRNYLYFIVLYLDTASNKQTINKTFRDANFEKKICTTNGIPRLLTQQHISRQESWFFAHISLVLLSLLFKHKHMLSEVSSVIGSGRCFLSCQGGGFELWTLAWFNLLQSGFALLRISGELYITPVIID